MLILAISEQNCLFSHIDSYLLVFLPSGNVTCRKLTVLPKLASRLITPPPHPSQKRVKRVECLWLATFAEL